MVALAMLAYLIGALAENLTEALVGRSFGLWSTERLDQTVDEELRGALQRLSQIESELTPLLGRLATEDRPTDRLTEPLSTIVRSYRRRKQPLELSEVVDLMVRRVSGRPGHTRVESADEPFQVLKRTVVRESGEITDLLKITQPVLAAQVERVAAEGLFRISIAWPILLIGVALATDGHTAIGFTVSASAVVFLLSGLEREAKRSKVIQIAFASRVVQPAAVYRLQGDLQALEDVVARRLPIDAKPLGEEFDLDS